MPCLNCVCPPPSLLKKKKKKAHTHTHRKTGQKAQLRFHFYTNSSIHIKAQVEPIYKTKQNEKCWRLVSTRCSLQTSSSTDEKRAPHINLGPACKSSIDGTVFSVEVHFDTHPWHVLAPQAQARTESTNVVEVGF